MQTLHDAAIVDVVASPKDSTFATVGQDGTIKVWSCPSVELVHSFELTPLANGRDTTLGACSLQFCKEGTTLYLAGGGGECGVLAAWDLKTKQETLSVYGTAKGQRPYSDITGLAVASDSALIVTSHVDGCIRSWKSDGKARIRDFVPKSDTKNDRKEPPVIAINGNKIGVLDPSQNLGEKLRLFSTQQEQLKFSVADTDLPAKSSSLKFSSDGKLIAACGEGLSIWEVDTGSLVAKLPSDKLIDDVAISSEQNLLTIVQTFGQDNAGCVWAWKLKKK